MSICRISTPSSKVFVNIGLGLDGFMAPEGMTLEHWDDPGYEDWGAKWGRLMNWIFPLESFRQNLKLGPGGETGPVNGMLRRTTERIGANTIWKRVEAGDSRTCWSQRRSSDWTARSTGRPRRTCATCAREPLVYEPRCYHLVWSRRCCGRPRDRTVGGHS